MKPLEEMIDERATRKDVQAHLKIFERLKLQLSVDEDILKSKQMEIGCGCSVIGNPKAERLLGKISYVDKENEEIKIYIDWFFKSFNQLQTHDRNILIDKYLFCLDSEEMEEKYGLGERKLRDELKNAEINLAFLLKCVRIKKRSRTYLL